MPDTLDLADRANLAIGAMIGGDRAEVQLRVLVVALLHAPFGLPALQPVVRSEPTEPLGAHPAADHDRQRVRAGLGREDEEVDVFAYEQRRSLLQRPFRHSGRLVAIRGIGQERFNWPTKEKEDFTNICGMGTLLYAMVARYLRDGDQAMRSEGSRSPMLLSPNRHPEGRLRLLPRHRGLWRRSTRISETRAGPTPRRPRVTTTIPKGR